MGAARTLTVFALAAAAAFAAPSRPRPAARSAPIQVALRDGDGTLPRMPRTRPAAAAQTAAARKTYDAQLGNNFEAALQAKGCAGFLRTYLPDEISFGDVRFYLKLVANEEAELSLEDGGELKQYRRGVEIAYLIVSVDGGSWASAPDRFRRALCSMFLPLLRSLYPRASLYVTVYDGQAAVANANWKTGSRNPLIEVN